MRETIAAVIGIATAGLVFFFNWILGVVAWIGLAIIGYTLSRMHERSEETRKLNGRIENMHLLTAHPDNGIEPYIERHVGNYTVVEHGKVFEEAEKLRQRLEEAKNPLYLGVDDEGNPIPKHLRIEVKAIIYRHGDNCNELWEEYVQRAEQEISASRQASHGEYAAKAMKFYLAARYGHGDGHLRREKKL